MGDSFTLSKGESGGRAELGAQMGFTFAKRVGGGDTVDWNCFSILLSTYS